MWTVIMAGQASIGEIYPCVIVTIAFVGVAGKLGVHGCISDCLYWQPEMILHTFASKFLPSYCSCEVRIQAPYWSQSMLSHSL
jgi:hypothetical protein